MTDEQKAKCKMIVDHYGIVSQRRQLIEECAELIERLCKIERFGETPEQKRELFYEITDVEVMIEQIKQHYEYNTNKIIEYKLARQLDRISKEAADSVP
ncbi:MAG: hypothetical protein IJ172_00025 [Ruminococcus sp.]|nr:hypothetical protein [Ruminococcus sp.]